MRSSSVCLGAIALSAVFITPAMAVERVVPSLPPPLPTLCGGALCASVGEVHIDQKRVAPDVTISYRYKDLTTKIRFEYPDIGDVEVVLDGRSTCSNTADRATLTRQDERTALAKGCGKRPESSVAHPIVVTYRANGAAYLRHLVDAVGPVWIANIRPALAWGNERAIILGSAVDHDALK
jgi:hypothetical protein